ncbi:SCO2524 family protein [Nocardia australiensis]|uniref:SCO2524 family protein n=1 Tax=Nocardia australiensis TaxID=2887191 RepID=UPI001D151CC8|nr:SCO2524 family protein [Nocardia australiensis]
MRIQPRQQLLDVWRAVLAACYHDGTWSWGGRDGSNSISDTEQMLCLLYPATEIEAFALDSPDDMAEDIKAALAPLGEETRIGGVIVGVLEDYIARYTGADGEPTFAAGGYLRSVDDRALTQRQLELEVVDSYSMSLTLCIAALRFLRLFQRFVDGQVRREAKQLSERIDILRPQISNRLTGAMTGLVRSFVVHTPEPKSDAGQAILRMVNQTGAPDDQVIAGLARPLEPVRVELANDVKLGQTTDIDLADDLLLFECGWSWGVDAKASKIDFIQTKASSQPGYAASRPDLYFTIVALDGINDLISQRARELELLTKEQQQLADALRLRWNLTQRYWSIVARYGTGRWPLEDIPWRTSDGEESDYYSLAVSAMLLQDLVTRQSTDELIRAVAVFDQLGRRGRIISRVTSEDPAGTLHFPGIRIPLPGSETVDDGPPLVWIVPDFATMLFKRALQAARLSTDVATRDRLIALAESAMDHLDGRTLHGGHAAGLWDDAARVFGASIPGAAQASRSVPLQVEPSWYLTERVVECLVAADRTFREQPLSPPSMISRAVELLNEAEHLLNQEKLEVSDEDVSPKLSALNRIEQRLDRARRMLNVRPGTAFSLATDALRDLDELAYARQDATRIY